VKTDSEKKCEPDARLELDENAVCERCGRFGAFRFGGRQLCQECYTDCGSCCPEFGKDDLWKFDDEN
jgi:hypothetical protein